MRIRPAIQDDQETLLDTWLRSVRETHGFLSEDDIQGLLPLVRDHALKELELWVLESDTEESIGFMGLAGNNLEALFLAPEHLRCGGGRKLVEFARQLKGPLVVDVNEQNPEALRFYQSLGFVVVGRSELDSGGRPYPLIHLREES